MIVEVEWMASLQSKVESLMAFMLERIHVVIAAKGGHTLVIFWVFYYSFPTSTKLLRVWYREEMLKNIHVHSFVSKDIKFQKWNLYFTFCFCTLAPKLNKYVYFCKSTIPLRFPYLTWIYTHDIWKQWYFAGNNWLEYQFLIKLGML